MFQIIKYHLKILKFMKHKTDKLIKIRTIELGADMKQQEIYLTSNISDSVMFLMRGAKKRRSLAQAKAQLIQGNLGLTPKLKAIK